MAPSILKIESFLDNVDNGKSLTSVVGVKKGTARKRENIFMDMSLRQKSLNAGLTNLLYQDHHETLFLW